MENVSPPVPGTLRRLLDARDAAAIEDAWSEFVAEHSRLLLKVAATGGGGYDAKMDRYAFILAGLRATEFRRLRSYLPEKAKFSTWLVVVARRLCSDHERQLRGRFRGEREGGRAARRSLADLASAVPIKEDTIAARDDIAEELAAAERTQVLERAVNRLAPEDRLLLRLRYEDDTSVQEIRELLGFPSVFHVYRRMRSLHAELRTILRNGGVGSANE